jgi:hypothetical protein
MVISLRRLTVAALLLFAGLGLALTVRQFGWLGREPLALWLIPAAIGGIAALCVLLRHSKHVPLVEPERIEQLARDRLLELVRGTSLQLRDMRYRYSVRADLGSRTAFSAKVNQIRLGFVPVVLTDNASDRQGLGYVAFVYDGHRFRGPGLPCAGSRDEALAHAAKCVEPLAGLEDTAG